MHDSSPSIRSLVIGAAIVSTLAVTVRLPSCYESFWLDELHSAWCVWDTLGEVSPRADIGHQPPFYFVALWFWKQVVGGSEVALRLSSVLAIAASSAVLTVGVGRWARSIAGGVSAGLVLGLESNSLFFGTELRAYAFVILFASIALVCFIRLADEESRHDQHRRWAVFVVSILLAALSQPTSVGVLAWLALSLGLIWLVRAPRKLIRLTLLDGLLGLTVAAIGFALWTTTLGESWDQRSYWGSFATATRVGEIWEIWDWNWLILTPLLVAAVAVVSACFHKRFSHNRQITITTVALAAIAVLATALYWTVARLEWVPLWHRRYFIAVLPIFACIVGGCVAMLEISFESSRKSVAAGLLAAVSLVGLLVYHQGKFSSIHHYPVALVTRGEDWRSAIEWVGRNANPVDRVYLDAGLVEAQAWLGKEFFAVVHDSRDVVTIEAMPASQPTKQQLEYLLFPIRGPYQLDREAVPIRHRSATSVVAAVNNEQPPSRDFTIIRQAEHQVDLSREPADSWTMGFGNVTVIVRPSVVSDEEAQSKNAVESTGFSAGERLPLP